MHLAQLNIAKLIEPLDHPKTAPFINAIEKMNEIAERTDGFIWRLKGENGNATELNINDDPMIITNMSVWRDANSLKNFVWNTIHKQFVARKEEWFEVFGAPYFVMWWVEEGHVPDLEEARDKLNSLNKNGENEFAFGWNLVNNIES